MAVVQKMGKVRASSSQKWLRVKQQQSNTVEVRNGTKVKAGISQMQLRSEHSKSKPPGSTMGSASLEERSFKD